MNRCIIFLIFNIIIFSLCAYSQSSRIVTYSFTSGFAVLTDANTTVTSSVGETLVGISQAENTILRSGFLGYHRITVGLDGEPQHENLPKTYSLSQNYPNPFNPSTIIKFGLPKAGHAILEVYNILGQRVAILIDGYQPAGYHEISFNAQHLASGVYVYRLTTGETGTNAGQFSAVRKMIFMK